MKSLKPNKIDFMSRYKEGMKSTKKSKKKKGNIWTLLIILSILIVGGITAYKLFNLFFVMQPQLNELKAYSEDEGNLAEYYSALEQFSARDISVGEQENYKTAFSNLDSYPNLDDSVMEAVKSSASGYADIIGISYDHDTGYLTVTFSTTNTQSPTHITSSLDDNALFSHVFYYGYESTGEALAGEDGGSYAGYTFDVACVIVAPDGGESNE